MRNTASAGVNLDVVRSFRAETSTSACMAAAACKTEGTATAVTHADECSINFCQRRGSATLPLIALSLIYCTDSFLPTTRGFVT